MEALTASGSPSLRTLVGERWKESEEKLIDWSHTDSATVVRALTYLYTGDYEVPDPEPKEVIDTSDAQACPEPPQGGIEIFLHYCSAEFAHMNSRAFIGSD